ncbi:hypothetical protein JOY44_23750 [Phormidium sp. CLA17]|uniref:hypothetical protein n=1 Tax=Leptolyngbya sp. Cla-17 TaxID=2803751 RepID=UPI0017E37157|nr:hypothetical protein [Leptolyngbya sp. Cla-17]MBM0744585.1 hypothetical protein [Leptolyngbya sp. Cla-17]
MTLAAFTLTFFNSLKVAEIGKPGSDRFAGIGAFNLVRKSMFDQTEGFSWLRMEVVDDLGLGLMLHRVGAKSCLLVGTDEIGLTWYSSLADMVRGLEKNFFGVAAHYRYSKLFTSVVLLWLLSLGWGIAFLPQQVPLVWGLGIATYPSYVTLVKVKSRQNAESLSPTAVWYIRFIVKCFEISEISCVC